MSAQVCGGREGGRENEREHVAMVYVKPVSLDSQSVQRKERREEEGEIGALRKRGHSFDALTSVN